MPRNLLKTCEVCMKTMRGDVLKRHMKKHDKVIVNDQVITTAKCEICMKHMRKDNLSRHMKVHEKKSERKEKKFLDNITFEMQEYNRKIELGRKIKEIMDKNPQFNENGLSKDNKEALEIFNLYGKSRNNMKVDWRGWQEELRKYLKKPSDREIIWVIGKSGNQGKSFFQEQIREEFGYDKVCSIEISDSPKNIFYILKKSCSTANIFLFNLPRATVLERENYKILENIKDGAAIAGKYHSTRITFNKPNVVMVFSNYAPETDALSSDRWTIFNISADLLKLEKISARESSKYLPQQNTTKNSWQIQKKKQGDGQYYYYMPDSP